MKLSSNELALSVTALTDRHQSKAGHEGNTFFVVVSSFVDLFTQRMLSNLCMHKKCTLSSIIASSTITYKEGKPDWGVCIIILMF
jgi:hypothetical protein